MPELFICGKSRTGLTDLRSLLYDSAATRASPVEVGNITRMMIIGKFIDQNGNFRIQAYDIPITEYIFFNNLCSYTIIVLQPA